MLNQLVTELGIEHLPNRFFNLDETGLNLDPKAKKLFFYQVEKTLSI